MCVTSSQLPHLAALNWLEDRFSRLVHSVRAVHDLVTPTAIIWSIATKCFVVVFQFEAEPREQRRYLGCAAVSRATSR